MDPLESRSIEGINLVPKRFPETFRLFVLLRVLKEPWEEIGDHRSILGCLSDEGQSTNNLDINPLIPTITNALGFLAGANPFRGGGHIDKPMGLSEGILPNRGLSGWYFVLKPRQQLMPIDGRQWLLFNPGFGLLQTAALSLKTTSMVHREAKRVGLGECIEAPMINNTLGFV